MPSSSGSSSCCLLINLLRASILSFIEPFVENFGSGFILPFLFRGLDGVTIVTPLLDPLVSLSSTTLSFFSSLSPFFLPPPFLSPFGFITVALFEGFNPPSLGLAIAFSDFTFVNLGSNLIKNYDYSLMHSYPLTW